MEWQNSLLCLTRDTLTASHSQQVNLLSSCGVKFIQLRSKQTIDTPLRQDMASAVRIAHKHSSTIVINDSIDLAQDVQADGVHLGIDDGTVSMARNQLGPGKLIGKTVHSLEEAISVKKQGPDYVGLGPYRYSQTKKNLQPVLSDQEFREIVEILYPTPVFLIGGLTSEDFSLLPKLGVTGIALCSTLYEQSPPEPRIRSLVKLSKDFNHSLIFS